MTYEKSVSDYLGEDLSLRHAVKQGTHDGISDIVKYAMMGVTVYIVAEIVLQGKARKTIRKLLPL